MNEYIIWVRGSGFCYKDHKAAMEAYERWIDAGYEAIVQIIYEEKE